MLLLHILIALTSIVFTGYMSFSPSLRKLHIVYGLVIATLGSGLYLILTTHTHMLSTCLEGLVYIGCVVVAIVFAKRRLAPAAE